MFWILRYKSHFIRFVANHLGSETSHSSLKIYKHNNIVSHKKQWFRYKALKLEKKQRTKASKERHLGT